MRIGELAEGNAASGHSTNFGKAARKFALTRYSTASESCANARAGKSRRSASKSATYPRQSGERELPFAHLAGEHSRLRMRSARTVSTSDVWARSGPHDQGLAIVIWLKWRELEDARTKRG